MFTFFTGYFSVLTVLKSQILSSYFVTAFIEDKLNIFLTKQKQVIQISLELVRRASSVCGKLSLNGFARRYRIPNSFAGADFPFVNGRCHFK